MRQRDIGGIIDNIKYVLKTHNQGIGQYARWIWQNKEKSRSLLPSEYGCADAANILYTIGEFPKDAEERSAWVQTLQSFQNPKTGLFQEPTHHFIHTTAHCAAALELFDADCKYPMHDLMQYTDIQALYGLLDGLDWKHDPWSQSHRGAGIYAALVLTNAVDSRWQDSYFAWLRREADPETGLWRLGCVKEGSVPVWHHMAGSFHYLFNHEYAKQPLPFPEKMIDTMLWLLYKDETFREVAAQRISFIDVDWIYCLSRAMRQTGYRRDDGKQALETYADRLIDFLETIDLQTHDGFNDLHGLFGTVCALAELQQALPGKIKTERPLKLVLDRRPFI